MNSKRGKTILLANNLPGVGNVAWATMVPI